VDISLIFQGLWIENNNINVTTTFTKRGGLSPSN